MKEYRRSRGPANLRILEVLGGARMVLSVNERLEQPFVVDTLGCIRSLEYLAVVLIPSGQGQWSP